MERPDWVPDGIDTEKHSAARAYDYLLGGSHNFAIDREAARQAIAAVPDVVIQAQANRAFLHRAIRWLVGAGVRQFLDIGSGIPTRGNVHEVAQRESPDARVVYVDIDPVAVAHGRHLLADNPRATAIQEDLRRPEAILAHPEVRAQLDLDQPVAVLLLAILHAIGDDQDPYGLISRLCAELPSGSYLVISHGSDEVNSAHVARIAEISKRGGYPLTLRSRARMARFYDGFDLVEPGLVWTTEWHPEPDAELDDPHGYGILVGVGRKR